MQDILTLKFNLAENKLVSLIEANNIEFHKVLIYQKLIIDRNKENAE